MSRLHCVFALSMALIVSSGAAENSSLKVQVYITQKTTGQKLARTDDLTFVNLPQPTTSVIVRPQIQRDLRPARPQSQPLRKPEEKRAELDGVT